jgi:hypothetical protein
LAVPWTAGADAAGADAGGADAAGADAAGADAAADDAAADDTAPKPPWEGEPAWDGSTDVAWDTTPLTGLITADIRPDALGSVPG